MLEDHFNTIPTCKKENSMKDDFFRKLGRFLSLCQSVLLVASNKNQLDNLS